MSIQDQDQPEASEVCDWRDAAWSFALGGCSEGERDQFNAHLLEGCALCGSELIKARSVIADLDHAVAKRTLAKGHGSAPGPSVRSRLLAEIDACKEQDSAAPNAFESVVLQPTSEAGVLIAARSEEDWQATPFAGVKFKVLSTNAKAKTSTALVSMAPNSSYPSHRHRVREECYVISGDLCFGDQELGAGDYQLAQRDSIHPLQSTKQGCMLLIIASLEDELLA